MRNFIVFFALLLASDACLAQSCSAPEDPGPYAAGWRSVSFQRGSRTLNCRVYYPAASSGQNTTIAGGGQPYPIIAFGHGFMAQNTYYLSYFEHLASRGYVTIAPQFPDTQHGELALDLLYCLTWLRTQHGTSSSLLFGALDTAAAGVSGHSMGGGASLLAASYDSRVRIAAPLAPAETTPSAIAAMPSIIGSICLISGSSDGITPPASNQIPMYNAASPCKSLPLLLGGNHTRFMDTPIGDWTDPNGNLSRPDQQLLARRYMTAAFDLFLKNDTCGWHYSYGSLSTDSRVTMTAATKYLAPRPFTLISPLRGSYSGDVLLEWHRARTLNPRDTVAYTIQLADDANFASIFRQLAGNDSTFTVLESQLHASNHWRVIARNSPSSSTLSSNYGLFSHPVPVELLSFSADVLAGTVVLSWTTASETNCAGFVVEKSRDGLSYASCGFVPGAGTSRLEHRYAFENVIDDCPFFRLRQMDTDGSFEYSPVIRIESAPYREAALAIVPNVLSPSMHGQASVTYVLPTSGHVLLRLMDATGRCVRILRDASEDAGSHAVALTGSAIPAGLYFVTLRTADVLRVARFIVLR